MNLLWFLLWLSFAYGCCGRRQHGISWANVSTSDPLEGADTVPHRVTCADQGHWTCDNRRQCIDHDQRCDGVPDCADRSDEIAANCIHFGPCPDYAFRCAYGACIAGIYRCDGHVHCADGSDETAYLCADYHYPEIAAQLAGQCSWPDAMQCRTSGECIDQDRRCDGRVDCADGSDETVAVCSYLYCPPYAFLCGYGGCVSGNSKCNGVPDCADGSDEAPELCGFERVWNSTLPLSPPVYVGAGGHGEVDRVTTTTRRPTTTTTTATATTTTKTPWLEPASRYGCQLPFNRKHLLAFDVTNALRYRLGDIVADGQRVNFACTNSWRRDGAAWSRCKNSKWSPAVPHCSKNCSGTPLLHGFSAFAECKYNGKKRPCADSSGLPMGTKAKMTCAPGYRGPNGTVGRQVVTCDQDAEWDYPKIKCEPICGRLAVNEAANVARPWEVSIFSRTWSQRPVTYKYFCGGVIISPKLVLSAGACLQLQTGEFNVNPVFYNIVEGQQRQAYRQLAANVHRGTHNVSEILRLDAGAPTVALLQQLVIFVLVNHFQFGNLLAIQPICLNFPKEPVTELTLPIVAGLDDAIFDVGSGISSVPHGALEAVHYLDTIVSGNLWASEASGGNTPPTAATKRGSRFHLLPIAAYAKLIQQQMGKYYYLL